MASSFTSAISALVLPSASSLTLTTSASSFIYSYLENSKFIISSSSLSYKDFLNNNLFSLEKNIYSGFNLKARNFRQPLAFVLFIQDTSSLLPLLDAYISQAESLCLSNYLIIIKDISDSLTSFNIYLKEFNKDIRLIVEFTLLEAFKAVAILEGYKFKEGKFNFLLFNLLSFFLNY